MQTTTAHLYLRVDLIKYERNVVMKLEGILERFRPFDFYKDKFLFESTHNPQKTQSLIKLNLLSTFLFSTNHPTRYYMTHFERVQQDTDLTYNIVFITLC